MHLSARFEIFKETAKKRCIDSLLQQWWRKYKNEFKTSVFQIRLGNTRAVVVNSFEDCKRMLIGNQTAVIDRPKLYVILLSKAWDPFDKSHY